MTSRLSYLAALVPLTMLCCLSSSETSTAASNDGGTAEPVGCAAGPDAGGGYNPPIDPASFTTKIDNPYYPLVPGTVQHLTDTEGNTIEITVTSETKVILGVTCVVVHDSVTKPSGKLEEDTIDWFAQDKDGNVWYFGEDTKAYGDNGEIDTRGSWTGGVDCAKPGIVMEAHPKVGDAYRQEFYPGQAEDQAEVLGVNESVTVPYGTFTGCLMTRDFSRFAPGGDEHKYYCPGIGNLKTIDLPESSNQHEDLVSVTAPP